MKTVMKELEELNRHERVKSLAGDLSGLFRTLSNI